MYFPRIPVPLQPMRNILRHIAHILALVCLLAALPTALRAKTVANGEEDRRQASVLHRATPYALHESRHQNQQALPCGHQAQRIGSPRTARTGSSSGSKSGRNIGRHAGIPFSHNNIPTLYANSVSLPTKATGSVPRPRFYYVIALRRIIC